MTEQPVTRVEAQIARCRDLLPLLVEEREAILEGDSEQLVRVVALKQPLVDALLEEGHGLEAVPASIMDPLTALLREVVAHQDGNQKLLAERMGAVRDKLRSLGQGRQTLNAYGASFKGGAYAQVPRFIDRSR